MKVTQEEWEAWLDDPVTVEFRQVLQEWREGLKEQWAQGQFQSNKISETSIATAQALAQVNLLEKLQTMNYEELVETANEE